MDEREFTSKIAGEIRSYYGEFVYFQPYDLPFDIEISNRIRRKSLKAIINLAHLDGKASEMEKTERDIFLKVFSIKESSHSSSIEGTRSTTEDLYRYEKQRPASESQERDAREVLNYRDALELGLRKIREGEPLGVQLFHEMHRTLLQGVRGENKSPGEFKTIPNAIGRPGDTLETAKMVPASPESVDHLIDNLLEFLDSEEDPIIKIALAHYQFEVIHPYRDGNGRMGRMLILLLLAKEGILHYPVIYPSEYFDRRRGMYIDRLFDVSSKDMFDEWFDFFIDALNEQAKESIRLIDSLKRYKRYLQGMATSKLESDIINLLFMNPYVNSRDVMDNCGVTNPTAVRALSALVDKGILREITGKKRNALYAADEILEILSGKFYEYSVDSVLSDE